jgi:hypothetical protein
MTQTVMLGTTPPNKANVQIGSRLTNSVGHKKEMLQSRTRANELEDVDTRNSSNHMLHRDIREGALRH